MKMMSRIMFTMLFAMLFCPIMLMAQKVKTVAGEYTYAAPQMEK